MNDGIEEFQKGFRGAIENPAGSVSWTDKDVMILMGVVLTLAILGLAWHLYIKYLVPAMARRSAKKKQDIRRRVMFGEGLSYNDEAALLKRLIGYYTFDETSGSLHATQEQFLHFSHHLLGMIRRLEYDKRGRLVVPEIEKKMRGAGPAERMPLPKIPAEVWGRQRFSKEAISKSARAALALIRFRQPSP